MQSIHGNLGWLTTALQPCMILTGVEAATVQRACVRNMFSETQIPPLPSPGNLGFLLRASTSPSA